MMRSARRRSSGKTPWRPSAFSSTDCRLPPARAPRPQQLTAQILKASAPPKASALGAWWRSLGRWQWMSIAGAAALASILVVAGMPVLQQMMNGGGPLQVAMVTINDRGPLFEASDLRMRGTTPPPGRLPGNVSAMSKCRPACSRSSLRRQVNPGAQHPGDRALCSRHRRERRSFHPGDRRLVAEAKARHGGSRSNLVRVYDLDDPRSADVRSLIGLPPGSERAFLLTVKP